MTNDVDTVADGCLMLMSPAPAYAACVDRKSANKTGLLKLLKCVCVT